MSVARSRRRGNEQNLDSLLDTMANVTGILIVLLAVTQISVGDAMTRLRDDLDQRPELSPASLAQAEAEARSLQETLAPLLPRGPHLEILLDEQRTQLAALQDENTRAKAEIDQARELPRGEGALRDAVDARRSAQAELEARALRAREELREAEVALSGLGDTEIAQVARLPDPRPAPEGSRQIVYFCRHGRILRGHARSMLATLRQGTLEASGGRWSFGHGPPNFVDRGQLQRWFRSHDVGTREFRWHVVDNGPRELWAQLEWRDRSLGETLATLSSHQSDFERQLGHLDPRRVHLSFFVWDDSFPVYVKAREVAEAGGFSAGWEAYGEHAPFRQSMVYAGGGVGVD